MKSVAPIASRITALLGPTNTGKTHTCIEQMLGYPNGMIGLPLRLLAREVYDRVSLRVGENRVALVTGEEKRVPRAPDYWICTVEAMPIEREVDFLAVDEIQLVSHPSRGHVFTDRLLNARGRIETWFLGSDTVAPLISRLVPTASLKSRPRLSQLTYSGQKSLGQLPPRSAVIAFSLPEVYELAERIRIKRGGAAVVLGALSPRTRNAQVAMYQAGEVDYLVATDAIGMGLNLAIDHVAFASTRKFDGARVRDLEVAEFAQIAGRAGRHVSNGTFGTLRPCHLPEALCRAIEQHRFPAEQTAIWRNADLCFDSVPRLLESLAVKPSRQGLRPTACAEDDVVLRLLAERPRVRELAMGAEAVSLLWEACQIPDYRKLLPELHAELVGGIFEQLVTQGGTISEAWLGERLERLAVLEGDLDTLIARISFVRTWTYVTHRRAWLQNARVWQERARAIEDSLSDALHERLVQRFVEAGRKSRGGRAERLLKEALAGPFGKLALLRGAEATSESDSAAPTSERWVESVVSAEASELRLSLDGQIDYAEVTLGRLRRGKDILLPELVVSDLAVGAGARQRIQRRLQAHTRDLVAELLRGLSAPDDASAALRGLVYQLRQGLGCVSTVSAKDQLAQLSASDRGRLQAAGVVFGQFVVFLKSSLRARSLLLRAALSSAYFNLAVAQLNAERVSLPREHGLPSALYWARGFYPAGPRVIRCDVLERALTRAAEGSVSEAQLGNLLGCPRGEVRAICSALGLAQRQPPRAAQSED